MPKTWFERRRIACAGIAASMLSLASLPAFAAGLPPLEGTASAERHPGKVIFAQLVTPDLDAAKRFYGGLFGWTFKDVPVQGRRYVEAVVDGAQVAGMIEKAIPPGGSRRPSWLTFISAGDVDQTTDLAVHYGARVLFKPRVVADLGREAVLADPQGAVFAVLASSSGDPPDALADDGTWIWSSLITGDTGEAASFYRVVFGYQVYAGSSSQEARHLVLATESYARASINPYPVDKPNYRPRWINFLRVEGIEPAVAKVISLGGRVLVPAHTDREGDPVAIVADPQGAVFGLLEWSSEKSQENAK